MSKQNNLTDFLTDVADAIREKKGTTEKINPQNFSDEIRGIKTGGGGNVDIEYADESVFGPPSWKKVTINEDVTTIPSYSFYGAKLDEVSFPQTLTKIEPNAFLNAQVTQLIGLESTRLESISDYTFDGASLGEVNLPSTVSKIGERAFRYAKLKEIHIPIALKQIGMNCFFDVKTTVYIPNTQCWLDIDGPNTDAFPNTHGSSIVCMNEESAEIVDISSKRPFALRLYKTIKEVFLSGDCTVIPDNFFDSSSLQKINLENVEEIGAYAFANCKLLSVNIENVVNLKHRAFRLCTKITNPFVFRRIETIGEYVFYESRNIPYFDFRQCVSIPTIQSNTFENTETQIVVPDTLYDQWIAATNWSTYASRIVKASEFVEPTNE